MAASLVLAACPGEPPQAPPPRDAVARPLPPPPAPQADGRLPPLATPTRYTLDLDVDPRQPRFTGQVRIEVDVPRPTSYVVLHGRNLRVTRAEAVIPRQAPIRAAATARAAHGAKSPEELVLAFDGTLPQGQATIVIDYSAPFDEELSGLYRLEDGGLSYAFSQFEPTDARRAFPCFDEPSFKVPFDVSIVVPQPMIAVANAPEVSREPAGEKTRFRFARTQPLPTYLVAFAVGELDVKDATRYSRPPLRIVTTKGKSGMSQLALEATSDIVDALASWFGIPYPYDKLDIVAVPDFRSGAMENPGLVTFREERLLLDPTRASVASRRAQALVIAHELAHQWFGDLVTATWWNDLWLNEGMATWMESRIVDKWRPAWGARNDATVSAHEVMDVDGLLSARAIRQPVVTTSEADEAFDGITYEKGAALITTIERWIGEEALQRGVREYLKDNAWKSVEAGRLLSALDKASGKDVTQMASSYLDKAGVPEVTARLECERGSRWHMELSSQQWRPLGSKLPEESDKAWTVPVCVRPQGEKKDTCAELVAGAPSLVAGRGCPAFVHPNWGASYYRFLLSEKEFVRLAQGRKDLDVPAKIALLSNAWAAVRSGQLDPKALLSILPAFDDDGARQVVDQVVAILRGMSDVLVDDDSRPAFRKFALARLTKRKKALGWTPSAKGDPSGDEALVRAAVLRAMADLAEDDATIKEAEAIAAKWLADPASVDPDTGPVALDVASRRAAPSRITELLSAAKTAKNREDRIVAIQALVGFDDEATLKQALDATLGEEIHANEMRYVIAAALDRRKARPVLEAWTRARWTDLQKKLPGALSHQLVRVASIGCSAADAEERSAFYGAKLAGVEGMDRGLAEALEGVSVCAALREKAGPPLRKALLGQKK